jgi:hypothetical protein
LSGGVEISGDNASQGCEATPERFHARPVVGESLGRPPQQLDVRIRCQVLVQPTISYNMMSRLTERKLKMDLAAAVEEVQRKEYGFGFADALQTIGSVKVPVLFTQVKDDVSTTNSESGINDIKVIFDSCPTPKELVWIGPDQPRAFGTGKRFDGYNYFNEHPEELLEFLAANLGTAN